jgi:predicted RNA-binding Zn-ribbon protein involved in translation (DUF1610 family)
MTLCPACGADSERIYRCSECDKDLVDVDVQDDEDPDPSPLAVTDGGDELPAPSDWSHEAVVHGAQITTTCRAITGDGNPCTNNAHSGRPLCGLHQNAEDPDVLELYHQWARITDGDRVVAVCINCQEVWDGGTPPLAVDCPTCPASVGQRCMNEDSVYQQNREGSTAAPVPPHPDRRDRARDAIDEYGLCPDAPGTPDDGQTQLLPDGGHIPGHSPAPPHPDPEATVRSWVCAGCDTVSDGRPEFIVEEEWNLYCSLVCYVDGEQYLREDLHFCDRCERPFDSIDELANHLCPPVPIISHEATLGTTVFGPEPGAYQEWEAENRGERRD